MHLKAPPDRVGLIADAIERDITAGFSGSDERQLTEILTWLRYRIAKWEAQHPTKPAA